MENGELSRIYLLQKQYFSWTSDCWYPIYLYININFLTGFWRCFVTPPWEWENSACFVGTFPTGTWVPDVHQKSFCVMPVIWVTPFHWRYLLKWLKLIQGSAGTGLGVADSSHVDYLLCWLWRCASKVLNTSLKLGQNPLSNSMEKYPCCSIVIFRSPGWTFSAFSNPPAVFAPKPCVLFPIHVCLKIFPVCKICLACVWGSYQVYQCYYYLPGDSIMHHNFPYKLLIFLFLLQLCVKTDGDSYL